MEVAKATLTGIRWIQSLYIIYQFTLFMMIAAKAVNAMNCPKECTCFQVLANDVFDPPTYSKTLEITNSTRTAVTCQRQQLTYVPRGFPRYTAVLFLTYNRLTHLNHSMFVGLSMIRSLDLSHNRLTSIANDTFDDMNELEQLDISYNIIRQLPKGFLCPWYRRRYISTEDEIGCNGWLTAGTKLRLAMGENPWHCTCRLQEFVEHFSCGLLPCIQFYSDRLDPVGECASPSSLRGISVMRLSAYDNSKNVNVCKMPKRKIDVPLLVTMFTWMGAVLGYVIYFILWNQREVAHHRSYLSTLHNRPEHDETLKPRSRVQERPLTTTDSILVRESRTSGKTLPEQYEMKQLGTKGVPTVHINEPSTPEVWVERSGSNVSMDSDDYGVRDHPRLIKVEPYQADLEVRSASSDHLNTETGNTDGYRISSL